MTSHFLTIVRARVANDSADRVDSSRDRAQRDIQMRECDCMQIAIDEPTSPRGESPPDATFLIKFIISLLISHFREIVTQPLFARR